MLTILRNYLLKPYDETRFKKTCEKVRQALEDRPQIKEKLGSLRNYLEEEKRLRIAGHMRNSKERIFIHVREVLYFHVQLTEVTAHLAAGDEYLVNATLKSLLPMLDPEHFQQTHRAYIANLDHIQKVSPQFGGNYEIFFKDPSTKSLPLSRRYAKKFKQFLKR